LLGCQRAAAAAGAGEGAPRGRVAQLGAARRGQREAGSERAGGGAEPSSLASEGSRGGRAPGGPPESRRMPHEELPNLQRPRYGCKYAGRARERPILGRPPLPRGLCWRGDEGRGERVCAVEGIGGQWLQSCEQEFQRAENGVFLLFSPNSDCQLAALTLHPENPSGRGGSFRGRDRPG
jgi:hypothetical protein